MPPLWNPTQGWLPAPSYVEPVAPPDAEPDAEPQVQLCFSRTWLPYVVGSLMQLTQPTTWDTDDDAVRQTALDRATALMEMFGTAGACEVLEMQIADCTLQFSVDGGDTWTTVTNWSDYTQTCLPPPPPPNPQSTPGSQNACNIATFLATQLIQGALVSAVDSFDHSLAVAAATGAILALIPGWGTFLSTAIDAGAGLYLVLDSGNRDDFFAASTDATLAKSLQCAIFAAISDDGEVTAGNFATLQTKIAAIAYSPSDVQDAINAYVAALGAGGLAQAQLTGSLYVGDCSDCTDVAWCWTIDFAVEAGGSQQYDAADRGANIYSVRSDLIGWHRSAYNVAGSGFSEASFGIEFTAAYITSVEMVYTANCTSGGQGRLLLAQNPINVANVATLTLSAAAIGGDQTVSLTVNGVCNGVQAVVRTNQDTDVQAIRSITIRGLGTSPFGGSNCTP